MREVGIDITAAIAAKLTWDGTEAAAVIITMRCGDACQVFPGKRYEDWYLDVPVPTRS